MDDQVPFKVYTFWREGSNPEVRRFGVDKNVVSNYNYLFAKIQEVFPNLKEKKFSITWKDEDGDNIKMSSDEEVMTMLTALRETVVKLYVNVQKSAAKPEMHNIINLEFGIPPPEPNFLIPNLHIGVVCDGCHRAVIGFRYKCLNCENFDLCGLCESKGLHSEHCFVRIPTAAMSMQMKKECTKKPHNFLKAFTVTAIGLNEQQKKQKVDKKIGCSSGSGIPNFQSARKQYEESKHAAAKDRREERREERQEKRQERQERQEKRREERQEERRDKHESARGPRTGWMDYLSKYLDQFANLAADHVRYSTTTEAGQYISPETIMDMANKQIAMDPADLEKMMDTCLNINNAYECPLVVLNRELMKMGEQESSSENKKQESTSTPQESSSAQQESVPQDPASSQASAFQPTENTANELPAAPQASTNQQALGVQADTLKFGVDNMGPDGTHDGQSTSSVEIMSRDTSPDKTAEDWTMINKEKDMDSDNAVAGPANPAPVENDLPKEFQTRSGTSHGLIYPPLNTATAVYDLKDAAVVNPVMAETGAAAQATVAPHAQMQAGQSSASAGPAKPSAPVREVRYHRVPHIDAAIRQMISMGFTNEGGWLTQLLESKDGNIASVLDLLTPVNPQRK